MRVLGLDLGTRRIGLALSDVEGQFASPAGFLERGSGRDDLARLCSLIEERDVGCVVVGLPIHMNGRTGPEAEAARGFARRLAEASGRRVELLDERWTTREAERRLREAAGGRRRRRDRGALDAAAATILLQTFLDRAARESEAVRDR